MHEAEQAVRKVAAAFRERMRNTRECAEGCSTELLHQQLAQVRETHALDEGVAERMLGAALWGAPE